MQKLLRRCVYAVTLTVMVIILAVNYYLSGVIGRNRQKTLFDGKLDQIVQLLERNEEELNEQQKSREEDYLNSAEIFAFMIAGNSSFLQQRRELLRIKDLLEVDELNVIDEYGILIYSSRPEKVGQDFHNVERMREFLQILDSADEDACLVQEARFDAAEGKTMQYIGVKRLDREGIVQIGIDTTRSFSQQEKNTCSYIFRGLPTGAGESYFAVDKKSEIIVGHTTETKVGTNLEDSYNSLLELEGCRDGGFLDMGHTRKYIVTRQYGDILLGGAISEEELYRTRLPHMIMTAFYVFFTAFAIAVVWKRLMQVRVIDGVHRILDSLEQIRNGDLETRVSVEDNQELADLSNGINEMVEGILSTTVKLSRVVELTGMPMAVFECRSGVKKVMATARLPEILELDMLDVQILLADSRMFRERLLEIQRNPVEGEKDVYQLDHDRYIKLRISGDGNESFGTVMDVTDEIREKMHIRYVHDHDPLTGLNIYQAFRRKVTYCLKKTEELKCAAGVMIDLDNFKIVNDSYGHDFGDTYLIRMAEVLRGISRNYGIAARRSGDEFAMFLYGLDSEDAVQETLRLFYKLLKGARIFLPTGEEATVSASAGVAYWQEGMTFEMLMNRADCALYQAKRSGRNTFREYREEAGGIGGEQQPLDCQSLKNL